MLYMCLGAWYMWLEGGVRVWGTEKDKGDQV